MRLLPLAALLLLTACGGSPDHSVSSAKDVGHLAGCSSVKPMKQYVATESGWCTIGKDRVEVTYFKSNQARDNYLQVGTIATASQSGGEHWLVGDHYLIGATSSRLKALQSKLGGDIKP